MWDVFTYHNIKWLFCKAVLDLGCQLSPAARTGDAVSRRGPAGGSVPCPRSRTGRQPSPGPAGTARRGGHTQNTAVWGRMRTRRFRDTPRTQRFRDTPRTQQFWDMPRTQQFWDTPRTRRFWDMREHSSSGTRPQGNLFTVSTL